MKRLNKIENGIICKERSEDDEALTKEYDAFIEHLVEKCSEIYENRARVFIFVENFHNEEYSCSCKNNLLQIFDGKGYLVATCEM